jgi:hypothetical protein
MEIDSPEYVPFTAAAQAAGWEPWVDFGADCLWSPSPDGTVAVGSPAAMQALTGEAVGWSVCAYDVDGAPVGKDWAPIYEGPDAAAALAAWSAAVTT